MLEIHQCLIDIYSITLCIKFVPRLLSWTSTLRSTAFILTDAGLFVPIADLLVLNGLLIVHLLS